VAVGQYSADGASWWNGTQWIQAQPSAGVTATAAGATATGAAPTPPVVKGAPGLRRKLVVLAVLAVVFAAAFFLSWVCGLVLAAVGLVMAASTGLDPGGLGRAITRSWARIGLPGVRGGTAGRAAAAMLAVSLVLVPGTIGGLGAYATGLVWSPSSEIQLAGRAAVATPLTGATVKVFELNSDGQPGALLATAVTGGDGYYTVSIQRRGSSLLLVTASGGSYVDTGSGKKLSASQGAYLRSIPGAGDISASLTPLTTFAADRAVALAGGGNPLGSSVDVSTAAISRQFNLETITAVAPAVIGDAQDVQVSGRVAREYGLILAGLAAEADALGVTPLGLADAVALDWSDGTLDGKHGTASILVDNKVALPADAVTRKLQDAINSVAASSGNLTHLPAPQVSLQAPDIDLNTAGLAYVSPNVLPAWIDGQAGKVTLLGRGGTSPYSCELASGSLPKGFSLSDDCTLSGDGTSVLGSSPMLITTPFTVKMSDASQPPQTVSFDLHITIIAKPPKITALGGTCPEAGKACSVPIATATGGTPPYYFQRGSFGNGSPPMGMTVNLNGTLSGKPTRAGPYRFQVCVVDLVGATDCETATVTVGESATPAQGNLPSGFPTNLPTGTYHVSICIDVNIPDVPPYTSCTDAGTSEITGDAGTIAEAVQHAADAIRGTGTLEYTPFNGTYFDLVITIPSAHTVTRIHVVKVP
jgi:hypothetical protein